MSLRVRAGSRLFSAVCSTELIAVKAPGEDIALTIGGVAPLTSPGDGRDPSVTPTDGQGGGTVIGKRYVDEGGELELLCTKAGDGIPALDGRPLELKAAKPLPASD